MKNLKKILFILLLLFSLSFNANAMIVKNDKSYTHAVSSNISYAKAKTNCFLFKTSDVTNSSYTNVFFVVPEGYFVMILNKVNTLIFKVQYKNKIGYVSSDSVKEVNFIPVNPELNNVTFDTLNLVGTQIRKQPTADDTSNVIVVIDAGITGISYISYISGAVPTGGSTDVWYFAQYQPLTDPTSVYEGYIYSEKVQNLSLIVQNTEGLEPENTDTDQSIDGDNEKVMTVNTNIKIILIVLICLPVVLIFILLIVGNKGDKSKDIKEYGGNNVNNENHKSIHSVKHSLESLKGKSFKEKVSSKLISQEMQTNKSYPTFPTYEVIDDDDLL